MPELDEQLRAVIDASVPPLRVDRVCERAGAPRRRGRRTVATAIVVLTATGLAAAAIVVDRSGARRTKVTTTVTTVPAPATGWHQVPQGPLSPRTEAITAWTGSEFLVWGGESRSGAATDGAAFSPATGTWELMARSPLTNTTGHFGVWDDNELLVWGQDWTGRTAGGSGAAYNPVTNTWRPIAPNAVPTGDNLPVTIWDGHEVLLWTASRPNGTTRPVRTYQAAYDPATDTWRALPVGPLDVTNGAAAWDGSELLIVGWLTNAANGVFPAGGDHTAAAYDPKTATWRSVPAPPWDPAERGSALTVAWTGAQLVAYTYSLHSATYSPATNTWRALADLPVTAHECNPSAASVAGDVLASYCGQMAVLSGVDHQWATLASPLGQTSDLPVVAAGPSYLLWGAAPGSPPAANAAAATVAWLYTPAAPSVPLTTPREASPGTFPVWPMTPGPATPGFATPQAAATDLAVRALHLAASAVAAVAVPQPPSPTPVDIRLPDGTDLFVLTAPVAPGERWVVLQVGQGAGGISFATGRPETTLSFPAGATKAVVWVRTDTSVTTYGYSRADGPSVKVGAKSPRAVLIVYEAASGQIVEAGGSEF